MTKQKHSLVRNYFPKGLFVFFEKTENYLFFLKSILFSFIIIVAFPCFILKSKSIKLKILFLYVVDCAVVNKTFPSISNFLMKFLEKGRIGFNILRKRN